jgi:hypothetical protein
MHQEQQPVFCRGKVTGEGRATNQDADAETKHSATFLDQGGLKFRI